MVAAGHGEVHAVGKLKLKCRSGARKARVRNDEGSSPPHGVAHAGGEGVGQVLAEQLLHEIERIEERAMNEDTPAAQRIELRDLEMHDAIIVALPQVEVLDGCDDVAIDGEDFDFVFAA